MYIRDEYDDDDASNDDCEGEFRRRMRKTSLATSLPRKEARRLGRAPLDIIIVVVVEIIIIVLDDDDGQESRRRARRRYRSRDRDRRERKRRRFAGAFRDDKSGIERNGQAPI